MKKQMSNINIHVCKISRRFGKVWLDFVFDLPQMYQLKKFTISFYPDGQDENVPAWEVPVSDFENDINISGSLNISGALSFTSISTYGVYYIELQASTHDDSGLEITISENVALSDVEFIYKCLVGELLALQDCCASIPDELLQTYLILCGHQLALQYGDLSNAKYLYRKLMKCGNPCQQKPLNCGCKHG